MLYTYKRVCFLHLSEKIDLIRFLNRSELDSNVKAYLEQKDSTNKQLCLSLPD